MTRFECLVGMALMLSTQVAALGCGDDSATTCTDGESQACQCCIGGMCTPGVQMCGAGSFGGCVCDPEAGVPDGGGTDVPRRDGAVPDSTVPDGGDAGSDAGACEDGTTETRPTPNCGEETRACAAGAWGAWAETTPGMDEPECLLGETRHDAEIDEFRCRGGADDGLVRYQVCSATCTWAAELSECGGGCPGERRTEPPDAAEMCMPAGVFQIGCPEERDRAGQARACYPVYPARLSAFYVDRYAVTVRRYQECVMAGACTSLEPRPHTHQGTSFVLDDLALDEPNVSVYTASWEQADAFCRWDGAELPTGAQWERAAKGNWLEARLPWDRSGSRVQICPYTVGCPIGLWTARPAIQFDEDVDKRNGTGIRNMFSFYEWTQDLSESPYPDTTEPVVDPHFAGEGRRELRGGIAMTDEARRYSAYDIAARDTTIDEQRRDRRWDDPSHASFRCARGADGRREGGTR